MYYLDSPTTSTQLSCKTSGIAVTDLSVLRLHLICLYRDILSLALEDLENALVFWLLLEVSDFMLCYIVIL